MRPPRRYIELPRPGEVPDEVLKEKQAAYEKLQQIQRKMMLLGLNKNDIERVMARGLPSGISTVITPTTGIVQEQFAFKGSYVNTGETVFTIANPKYTWARLEGYAADFRWIRLGQEAEFSVDAYPGEAFTGKVLYLDTEFDQQTRTFEVGVLYTDNENKFRPNMLVRCAIKAKMTESGVSLADSKATETPPLVIPETAPLVTGKRAVVYVENPGTPLAFETRQIALGPRARGYFVVNGGLREGERVVVEGNFKVDSAVQILAKPSMMEGAIEPMAGHMHREGHTDDMDMDMDMKTNTGMSMDSDPSMQMKMKEGKTEDSKVKPPVSRRDMIKERLRKLKENRF
jgi:Cu(I)/Ag(I) efflux system membrane fusion protein